MDLDTIRTRLPDGWLDHATVYFEESMVGDAAAKRGIRVGLPSGCDIRTFPTSSLHALWPFQRRDARLVPEPPIYNGGRYFESDAVAASLVNPAITDDALFDMYMELTEAAPLDRDAALAGLDRLTLGWCAHGRAVPVHPRVARHFGLTWWSPDMTYELGRNRFAFREYIIRCMRWSPWLV